MSAELLMVLSMRRREVAFQPHVANQPSMLSTPFHAGRRQVTMDKRPTGLTTALSTAATAGTRFSTSANALNMTSLGCASPHSVRQVAWTAAYDQFGFLWHWLMQIAAHYALQRQTAHLAMQYAQLVVRQRALRDPNAMYSRAMASSTTVAAALLPPPTDLVALQQDLQVLGVTCVFAAAKIEEVHPPKASELAEFVLDQGAIRLTSDEIVREEAQLLQELNWNLHPTTPYSWLLFLLMGEALEQPLFSTRDFAQTKILLSGRYELFTNAIRLIDVALLDGQAVEYLPSVLAGAALLLVDPMLEFLFTAHFLQLDPKVLWDCKNWLHCVYQSMHEFEVEGLKHEDRWSKVAAEDLVFVQTHVAVPTHLAYGVLAADMGYGDVEVNDPALYGAEQDAVDYDGNQAYQYGDYYSSACASPNSSDTYGCFCKGSYHVCANAPSVLAPAHNVYHYKFGWQSVGDSMTYDPAPTIQLGDTNGVRYA